MFVFHIKIHEISHGAIQKSNGLKVTCLMSLYLKSDEDTMKTSFCSLFWRGWSHSVCNTVYYKTDSKKVGTLYKL